VSIRCTGEPPLSGFCATRRIADCRCRVTRAVSLLRASPGWHLDQCSVWRPGSARAGSQTEAGQSSAAGVLSRRHHETARIGQNFATASINAERPEHPNSALVNRAHPSIGQSRSCMASFYTQTCDCPPLVVAIIARSMASRRTRIAFYYLDLVNVCRRGN